MQREINIADDLHLSVMQDLINSRKKTFNLIAVVCNYNFKAIKRKNGQTLSILDVLLFDESCDSQSIKFWGTAAENLRKEIHKGSLIYVVNAGFNVRSSSFVFSDFSKVFFLCNKLVLKSSVNYSDSLLLDIISDNIREEIKNLPKLYERSKRLLLFAVSTKLLLFCKTVTASQYINQGYSFPESLSAPEVDNIWNIDFDNLQRLLKSGKNIHDKNNSNHIDFAQETMVRVQACFSGIDYPLLFNINEGKACVCELIGNLWTTPQYKPCSMCLTHPIEGNNALLKSFDCLLSESFYSPDRLSDREDHDDGVVVSVREECFQKILGGVSADILSTCLLADPTCFHGASDSAVTCAKRKRKYIDNEVEIKRKFIMRSVLSLISALLKSIGSNFEVLLCVKKNIENAPWIREGFLVELVHIYV